MNRALSTITLSSAFMMGLTACATAPKAETLMTGISPTAISKPLPAGQMRAETDPICVNFYKNSRTFIAESNKPDPGGNFLKTVGIGVLAGVATGGIATSGINSTVGRIAAAQAANTAVHQGSNLALQGAKKSSIQAKISKAAEQISCPVNFS